MEKKIVTRTFALKTQSFQRFPHEMQNPKLLVQVDMGSKASEQVQRRRSKSLTNSSIARAGRGRDRRIQALTASALSDNDEVRHWNHTVRHLHHEGGAH
jgi:hypothetical protein